MGTEKTNYAIFCQIRAVGKNSPKATVGSWLVRTDSVIFRLLSSDMDGLVSETAIASEAEADWGVDCIARGTGFETCNSKIKTSWFLLSI